MTKELGSTTQYVNDAIISSTTYHSYFHDGFCFTGRKIDISMVVMINHLCVVTFLNKWKKVRKSSVLYI